MFEICNLFVLWPPDNATQSEVERLNLGKAYAVRNYVPISDPATTTTIFTPRSMT